MLNSDLWNSLKAFFAIYHDDLITIHALFLFVKSMTSLASSSNTTACKFRAMQGRMPSLNAHSSTATLMVDLMALTYPLIHSPLSFLISPPSPARPGLPKEDPLEFTLYQFIKGAIHLTRMVVWCVWCLFSNPKNTNSVALEMVFTFKLFWRGLPINITLFLCSHKVYIPKEKRVFQLIPNVDDGIVLQQL